MAFPSSSCLIIGDDVSRLRLVLCLPVDLREREVEDMRRELGEGLDPCWKGLSSEKGLAPSSRLALAGSTTRTADATGVGPGVLFLVFLDAVTRSPSVSVSDCRAFELLFLDVGVFDRLEVDGVASAKLVLDFRLRGVFGTGGGGIKSSSPNSVPS